MTRKLIRVARKKCRLEQIHTRWKLLHFLNSNRRSQFESWSAIGWRKNRFYVPASTTTCRWTEQKAPKSNNPKSADAPLRFDIDIYFARTKLFHHAFFGNIYPATPIIRPWKCSPALEILWSELRRKSRRCKSGTRPRERGTWWSELFQGFACPSP